MKKSWLILGFILLLQVGLRLPFLAEPLNLDEATYIQIAGRMSQGELLYRDLVDVKPPGLFYIYQLIYHDPFTLRLITALFSLLITLSLYFLGRQLKDERLGLAAAGLYALFSGGVFIEGAQSNPETFMVLPLLLALSCFLPGWYFLAGLFSGAAVLIKQTAAFNFIALGGFLLLTRPKAWGKKLAALTVGLILLPLWLIIYYWFKGALPELVNAIFFYSLGMVKPSLVNFLVKTALLFIFENSVLWTLAGVGVWLVWKRYRDGKFNFLMVWALASLAGVYAAGYALGHYYIQLIPALCLLGGLAIDQWQKLHLTQSANRLLIILLAVFGLFIIANEYEFYTTYGPDRIATERYGTPINAVAKKIGGQLKERTKPGDRVFGISSVIVYSGRTSGTKYYLTVRGGRSEVWFLGRRLYVHDFNITRDPNLVRKVDQDFLANLSDPRNKYWAVNLKDNYSPPGTSLWLKKYGYQLDPVVSDLPNAIFVFRRQ